MTTKSKLTIRDMHKALQALHMTLRVQDGEYRVAYAEDGKNSEAAAYYTNDRFDAVSTGAAMRRASSFELDEAGRAVLLSW